MLSATSSSDKGDFRERSYSAAPLRDSSDVADDDDVAVAAAENVVLVRLTVIAACRDDVSADRGGSGAAAVTHLDYWCACAADFVNAFAVASHRTPWPLVRDDPFHFDLCTGGNGKNIKLISDHTESSGETFTRRPIRNKCTYRGIQMWPPQQAPAPLRYCWACSWSSSNAYAIPMR